MTDKEFRRLNRSQLIEIIYELQHKELQLQEEISDLKEKLNDKELKSSTAGSLAEEAFKLNEVFEAAQAAADQYLQQMQKSADERANEILSSAKEEAINIVEKIIEEAKHKLLELDSKAEPQDNQLQEIKIEDFASSEDLEKIEALKQRIKQINESDIDEFSEVSK